MSTLEDSIRVLLTLYVTIEQDFHALQFYEKFLAEDVLKSKAIPKRSERFVDEAIIECLWFQIIIKSSSFIDEWDKFLGVNTSESDRQRLLLIKRIVSPARKEIMKWTDLKNFRNVIAHNLRNKKQEFSFHNIDQFNIPQENFELYFLVSYLDRMTRIVSHNYKKETNSILEKVEGEFRSVRKSNINSTGTYRELNLALKEIDDNMSNTIWDIVRYDIISANVDAVLKHKKAKEEGL